MLQTCYCTEIDLNMTNTKNNEAETIVEHTHLEIFRFIFGSELVDVSQLLNLNVIPNCRRIYFIDVPNLHRLIFRHLRDKSLKVKVG